MPKGIYNPTVEQAKEMKDTEKLQPFTPADVVLFETLECKGKIAEDHKFIKQLSKWILDVHENVNVSMRLAILADKLEEIDGRP